MPEPFVSLSRTYVAVCKSNFDGVCFRKFVLPDMTRYFGEDRNTCEAASWWFLNHLNLSACIEGCISFEDYSDISDQGEIFSTFPDHSQPLSEASAAQEDPTQSCGMDDPINGSLDDCPGDPDPSSDPSGLDWLHKVE